MRQASRQASRLWKVPLDAMGIAAKQTLCQDEASLEAGLEAMEMAIGCYENCSKTNTLLG